MSEDSQYVTEVQAAALAEVVHETVNNWGVSGKVEVITDKTILAAFNQNKPGRPSSRLYRRSEILDMKRNKESAPEPSDVDEWWTVRDMAVETEKNARAIYWALKTHKARTWKSASGKIYVHPDDAGMVMDIIAPLPPSEGE